MKTAIDAATGTAAESQLFGFESLQRGQRFVAHISADDSVPSDLFTQLVSSFDQAIRIGRSRTAQYGRVKTRVMRDVVPAQTDVTGLKSITLWLQSDMEVRDLNGMPTLLPENPAMLGLPNGRLEIEKSFVRFRSYAPYNAHHRGYESDRQVIVAGSVLHYEFDSPLGSADAELLVGGLGLHREAGLGVVSVNHSWLQQMRPIFSTSKPSLVPPSTRPEHPLIQFLERRNGLNKEDQKAKEWAEAQCAELVSIYASARNFKGVMPTDPIGPNRSQWRRVHEAVIQPHHISALFDEVDGICKSKDEDWGEEYAAGKNFRTWLEETIQRIPSGVNVAMCMQWLARKAESLCEATVKENK